VGPIDGMGPESLSRCKFGGVEIDCLQCLSVLLSKMICDNLLVDAPTFPFTGLHTVGVSRNYVDPLHFDAGDSGPALISLLGESDSVDEYFVFPDLLVAIPFISGQVLYFQGFRYRHATTMINLKNGDSAPQNRLWRTGITVQSSARVHNMFAEKGTFCANIPRLKALLTLPNAILIRLCFAAGGYCNGSTSFNRNYVNRHGNADFFNVADAFAGLKRDYLITLTRWMSIRLRFRTLLNVARWCFFCAFYAII
jgi:hypothetical protein